MVNKKFKTIWTFGDKNYELLIPDFTSEKELLNAIKTIIYDYLPIEVDKHVVDIMTQSIVQVVQSRTAQMTVKKLDEEE